MGESRRYDREVEVPGVHCDPAKMNEDTLWYRRTVVFPKGKWQYATLELKGARFAPAVFIDGQQVSRANGGMAPTFHLLKGKNVKPGKTATLEVALTSLADLPQSDASYIAVSDHWRSNISSCLWDDVLLHLYGEDHIVNIVPDADTRAKQVAISFFVEDISGKSSHGSFDLAICDRQGNTVIKQSGDYHSGKNTANISYQGILQEWSPERPCLYNLTITIKKGNRIQDKVSRKLGIKRFEVKDKQFLLNGHPYKIRGGAVAWHRWTRSPEGRELGYDTT